MSDKMDRKVVEKSVPLDMYAGSGKDKRKGDRQRGSSVRSRSGGSNDGRRERRRHTLKRRSTSRENDKNKSSSRSSRRRRDREDRRRHRRRSSSTSSSNDSRSRSRYAAGDRKIKKKRNGRKDRSASSDDYSDRCIGGGSRSAYRHDSYKFQEPNRTVMVRGLAFHHTENDIKTDVQQCGLLPKDIRLIRSRETGESRGFAFVEFLSVDDATRWMDIKKGVIVFDDQYQANVIYSNSKSSASNEEIDWYCDKCRGHNFKRREFCYKCYSPRKDSVGQYDVNSLSGDPTSTIILSNLDTLTTEADILQAFQQRADVACLPIKSVKIAREPATTISKGICYVEANCISEAISLFSVLSNGNLIIDGRQVSVAYSKATNVPSQESSNIAAFALAAAQWTNSASIPKGHTESSPPCFKLKTMEDVRKMAEYYAKLYAKTFDEYSSYFEYYHQYFAQEISQDSSEGRLKTVVADPRLSSLYHQSIGATANVNLNDSVVVVPGSQAFVQATGIQENGSITGLDCNFDLKSGKDLSRKLNKRKGQKVESNTKMTEAQRVTKKMEKWAKTLNEKSDELKHPPKSVSAVITSTGSTNEFLSYDQFMPSAAEIDVPNYLGENYVFAMENTNTYQPVVCTTDAAGNFGSVSSTTCVLDKLDPSNFVDESKLVCLLCKRRFSSKDVLQKHVTKSDLHQKNLSELRPRQLY